MDKIKVCDDDMKNINNEFKKDLQERVAEFWDDRERFYSAVSGTLGDRYLGNPYSIDESKLGKMIEDAISDGKNLEKKRTRGIKRVGQSTVDFAVSFRGLFVGYSDLCSILNGVAPRFGQLAYGTLAVMFAIGINKHRREDIVMRTLKRIQNAMPRMFSFGARHCGNKQVWSYLLDFYTAVIVFSKSATCYYTQRSYKRIWGAISRPALLVQENADNIEKAMHDIRDEMVAQMDRTISDLAQDQQDRQRKERETAHRHQVESLQDIFSFTENDMIGPTLRNLHSLLCGASFSTAPRKAGRKNRVLKEATLKELKEEPICAQWIDSPHSSMLVLSGSNYGSHLNTFGLCWLSSAILAVATSDMSQSVTVVYSSRNNHRASQGSVTAALCKATFQIMHANPNLCNEWYHRIEQQSKCIQDQATTIPGLREQLTHMISTLSPNPVYLLFDRIDLFSDMTALEFLYELAEILDSAATVVKILAVADSAAWRKDEEYLTQTSGKCLQPKNRRSKTYLKLRWFQPTADR